ncbi:MAG: hypothetical protein WC915_04880 [archaeon]|jgi:hypothetical protein
MNRKLNILLINILGFPGSVISFFISFYNQTLSLAFFFLYFGLFYIFLSKRILALIPTFDSIKKRSFFGKDARFQDQEYEPLIKLNVNQKILLVQGIGLALLLIGIIFLISF